MIRFGSNLSRNRDFFLIDFSIQFTLFILQTPNGLHGAAQPGVTFSLGINSLLQLLLRSANLTLEVILQE